MSHRGVSIQAKFVVVKWSTLSHYVDLHFHSIDAPSASIFYIYYYRLLMYDWIKFSNLFIKKKFKCEYVMVHALRCYFTSYITFLSHV